MVTIITHTLEELKKCVLIAAGIKNLIPADCKRISLLISNKTKQYLSETTIKRIYGFAYSKFNPSYFTIDVLAKYCGYENWGDFCEQQKSIKPSSNLNVNWQLLQKNANKITGFTLQVLKNKSGIPYAQTIKRDFIDDHINDFLASGLTGTVISAPAGYGKTIATCHWVEKKLIAQSESDDNDIVLFFSVDALMSVMITGRDINDWMLALLGYSNDKDISPILDETQAKNGKFYLIIDGLNGHMFKNDFNLIFKQLVNVFSLYQHHDWFKLILVTRTATWINYRHELEIDNTTWFTGFNNRSNLSNVPLFSYPELLQLCHKINPGAANDISIEAAENLNYPLYFQYYYKAHRENFKLTMVNKTDIYETISTYIYNKIHLGQNSAEKLLILKNLILAFDLKSNRFKVNKLNISESIKQNNQAYNELLSVGVLREINESDNYQLNINISFNDVRVLENVLATVFLLNNNNQFDEKFILSINNSFNGLHKINILKWAILHAIKSNQFANIEHLAIANLNPNQKLELLIFLGDVIEREQTLGDLNFNDIPISDKLFDYCLGIESTSNGYKKLLNTLLSFKLNSKKQIFIYTSLAIISIVQLDIEQLELNLNSLRSYPKAEYEAFIIHPLNCIDTVYYHFKYGIIKKDILIGLTKLQFNIVNYPQVLKQNPGNDMLYILGLFTLLLSNNPKKVLRFINALKTHYKQVNSQKDTSVYAFFLRLFEGNAYFELGNSEMVTSTYYSISNDFKKNCDMLTPYMKIIFHNLKIKLLVALEKEDQLFDEIRNIDTLIDREKYKLHKLFISSLLLKKSSLQNNIPALHKKVNYEYNKIIREGRLSENLFVMM